MCFYCSQGTRFMIELFGQLKLVFLKQWRMMRLRISAAEKGSQAWRSDQVEFLLHLIKKFCACLREGLNIIFSCFTALEIVMSTTHRTLIFLSSSLIHPCYLLFCQKRLTQEGSGYDRIIGIKCYYLELDMDGHSPFVVSCLMLFFPLKSGPP